MTREELRDYVEEQRSLNNISYHVYSELIDGIDTLEQEPCDKCVYSTKDGYCQYDDITETIPPFEPCGDAISRQAVLELLADYDLSMGQVVKGIHALPPVTPQPKIGHWIKVTNGRGGHECDICHEYAPSYQDGDEYLTKYCPNCGAKMEESEDVNDTDI